MALAISKNNHHSSHEGVVLIEDSLLIQPVSPNRYSSVTAHKKTLISSTPIALESTVKSLSTDSNFDQVHPFHKTKRTHAGTLLEDTSPIRSSTNLPINSEFSSFPTNQVVNPKDRTASAADTDSAFEQDGISVDSFGLRPLGDFEAIQGSLDRTFHEDDNNNMKIRRKSEPPGINKFGNTTYESDADSAIVSQSSDTVSIDDITFRHPSGKGKSLARHNENRHSYHHGPRAKLVYTSSHGNLTTRVKESPASIRSSISHSSLGSGVGSLQHKYSALIIESEENGTNKYYHIPPAMAKKESYTQKGQKLHIYNEHVFVATHFAGYQPICAVCNLPLRGLGKQGYTCRDCKAVVHKRCHFMIPTSCQSSSLSTFNIEYVGGTDV